MPSPIQAVLIANRGAIACRIIRTCKRMNVRAIAVFSDADAGSRHVAEADEAIRIGEGPAASSYLDVEAVLAAARASGADAIHPGYGFLSENAAFAEACERAGIAFIGPTPENIRAFGLKHTARAIAAAHGAPLAPGTGLLSNAEDARRAASEIGYPVIMKATAGGGGIGMRVCENPAQIDAAFGAVMRLGADNFGDSGVFLERYVRRARHVEVQVFGDGQGRVVTLGERDCSLQRRNQKVIEETPAPLLSEATREMLLTSSETLMKAAQYRSAGTVEYLYDPERGDFFFLEVNTRLQVEHGVTEQVTGVDLVEWMIRGAGGDYGFLDAPPPKPRGASVQARVYAEDPGRDFRPSVGRISKADFPSDARIETWVSDGAEISAYYDPMIAKVIATGADRAQAIAALQTALDETIIEGLESNLHWLRQVARDGRFLSGEVSTRLLDDFAYASDCVRVLSGGPTTTIQDYPGRLGYWAVGVPPSGPMDDLGFRLANRLLGNAEDAAGIEFAAAGPSLLFERDALICLSGADGEARLDGVEVARYAPTPVRAGQTLKIGRVKGPGLRGYLNVRGGWRTSAFLGSRSTFTLGGFGGPAGRTLAAGDVLRIADQIADAPRAALTVAAQPELTRQWDLRVLYGPHGAPDFFTDEDIATILAASWKVHHNSNPTGIRLIGPKPNWARPDGGEAGLHPSNIHDNAYAIGAVDFTGDMPIILGPDGPSLGGFVCPFVVIGADLWKVGQLAPGDSVRFVAVSDAHAHEAAQAQSDAIRDCAAAAAPAPSTPAASPILAEIPAQGARPRMICRRQGDRNLLIEYGPIVLDIELRLRVHALMQELEKLALDGVVDLTPGVRSLQVHFDPTRLPQARLIEIVCAADDRLAELDDFEIESRIVHLPLSWNDPVVQQTIDKYIASVRDDAPWTPNNIEFIRRINGLASIDEVKRIVYEANYLVLGLGDVYLGAPVATPIDPRHRLVTTKYNPARTWTPPNVVGIGGAYMCVYGMEGPGGYQLVGRTVQVWNTHRVTADFENGKPWLLRFFDQIRFFPVSHEELTEWRRDFPLGRRKLEIETTRFSLSAYRDFLNTHADDIAAFQKARGQAFNAEREAWRARGEFDRVAALSEDHETAAASEIALPPDTEGVECPLGGSVWKVCVKVGDAVRSGDVIAIIEAMKAEHAINAERDGVVRAIFVEEKQSVAAGAVLAAIGAAP